MTLSTCTNSQAVAGNVKSKYIDGREYVLASTEDKQYRKSF